MNNVFALTEEVKARWEAVINEDSLPAITDATVKNNTIRLLENQARDLAEAATTSSGDLGAVNGGTNSGSVGDGTIKGYSPVLISMVRRAAPTLVANDVLGVQPMSGPTGLIFAMKSTYASGAEALHDAADPAYSETTNGEVLGSDKSVAGGTSNPSPDPVVQNSPWAEMSFTIDKAAVTAKTRALKATYTEELATDLKNVHGLDAETELANILSTEIVAEQNREIVSLLFNQGRLGCQSGTATLGTWDVTDALGTTEEQVLKALVLRIVREAGDIAINTRRGAGNFIITTATIAGALETINAIDTRTNIPGVSVQNAGVGMSFAGMLLGRIKVYVDPYMTEEQVLVGYKGANAYDAGLYYCPYVPYNLVKAIGEDDFQPRMGFKTRYGLAMNPFVSNDNTDAGFTNVSALPTTDGGNDYYRKFAVTGLL